MSSFFAWPFETCLSVAGSVTRGTMEIQYPTLFILHSTSQYLLLDTVGLSAQLWHRKLGFQIGRWRRGELKLHPISYSLTLTLFSRPGLVLIARTMHNRCNHNPSSHILAYLEWFVDWVWVIIIIIISCFFMYFICIPIIFICHFHYISINNLCMYYFYLHVCRVLSKCFASMDI